ncbi:hypothetical protein BD413DRAFT_276027 [Trametes elegans]|nr:hypothetical protein BD413DRAFT_276027 [Trametes elegans]
MSTAEPELPEQYTMLEPSTSWHASSTASPPPKLSKQDRLKPVRDVMLQLARRSYPYYTPKDDLEILLLGGGSHKGPESGTH